MSSGKSPFKISSLFASVFVPSALFSTGEYALLPIIPASAEQLGASIPTAGFIAGLVMLGLLLADLPAAHFVNRVGEQRAMMWASVLALVSVGVAYFARNLWILGFAVLVVGVASAVFALARHAFMTEHVPLSHRARALSLLGGTFRAGAFIGPLASAGVIAWLGINAVFAFSLVIWLISAISLLITKSEISKINEETSIARTFVIAKREGKKLATVGVGAMMVGVLRTTRQVGLPLWALVIGVAPEKSTLYIGIAAVVDFALFYTSGQIMDRWGRRAAAVPTTIGLSLTHIFMFLAIDEPTFLIFAVLMSLANGLGSGLVLTLGADLAPDDARAEFLAGFRLLVDAGVAAAPPILAALTAVVGLGTGMAGFGVIGLGTSFLFYKYIPRFIKSPR